MWALTACDAWWLTAVCNSHPELAVQVTEKLRFLGIWEILNANHPEGKHLNFNNSLSHTMASARLRQHNLKVKKLHCIPQGSFPLLPHTGLPNLWFILKLFSCLFEQSWRCKTLKLSRPQRISSAQEGQLVLKIKRLLIEKTYKHKTQSK